MTFANLTSVGGYNLGEVASAMQKCIRRGLEADALFWATELDLSGYGEYTWKRLKIVTSEDIGLADPHLPASIHALYQCWLEQRKKADTRHGPERLFLVNAVLLLVRAEKSRLVDHALIAMYEAERPTRPVPDFALDKHTARGKALRRGHAHFWQEGAKLNNAGAVPDDYEAIARRVRVDHQSELI